MSRSPCTRSPKRICFRHTSELCIVAGQRFRGPLFAEKDEVDAVWALGGKVVFTDAGFDAGECDGSGVGVLNQSESFEAWIVL